MVIWKKDKKEETPVPSRIQKMHTSDLLAWMDVSIMQLGATFDQWRSEKANTEDVDMIVTSINNIWATLKERD